MKYLAFLASTLLVFSSILSQTLVLDEDFQNGIPTNWKLVTNDTLNPHPDVIEFNEAWIIKENPDSTGDSVIASTSYFENAGTANRWIITNQIQLGTYGNFLNWDVKSHDPSFPDGYVVLLSTTNDSLHNFTDTLFYTDFEVPNWTEREIQLVDSLYSSENVYIAFVQNSNDQFILYLDNIKVRTDDPLSVETYNKNSISSIYPNPFNTEVSIQTEEEIKTIKIYSITGQTILTIEQEVYQIQNLHKLDKGVYYIFIEYKNGFRESKKLIKE